MCPRRFTGFVVLVLIAWWWAGRGASVASGTFNIRFFPEPTTEAGAVVAAIEGLDADAFAVQEIVGVEAFHTLLRAASARSGAQATDRGSAARSVRLSAAVRASLPRESP